MLPPEVMDAIGPWGQLGLIVGMAALIITGLARGWLRPSSSVERENKHLEARLTDRDATIAELKSTNQTLRATNEVLAKSVQELVEIGRTSNAALTSLPLVGADQE